MALFGLNLPTQAYSNSGSSNSAQSGSWNNSASYSQTYAPQANANAAAAAERAAEIQRDINRETMNFNREEAQKSRDWEESMANTIYTRSVKNMKEAGINPILAANIGLSGASVGSGATASFGGSSAPMAQSFMDTSSASSASGESFGTSHGSAWMNSESGVITALNALGAMVDSAIDETQAAQDIEKGKKFFDEIQEGAKKYGRSGTFGNILDAFNSIFNQWNYDEETGEWSGHSGGGHSF